MNLGSNPSGVGRWKKQKRVGPFFYPPPVASFSRHAVPGNANSLITNSARSRVSSTAAQVSANLYISPSSTWIYFSGIHVCRYRYKYICVVVFLSSDSHTDPDCKDGERLLNDPNQAHSSFSPLGIEPLRSMRGGCFRYDEPRVPSSVLLAFSSSLS